MAHQVDVHSLAGMKEPQLTARAALVGVLVGGLMCFSNMYFGLQTGWVTMGSLQSTILGFGVFKLLRPYLRAQFGPLENVVLQTVAVATATMPLAGGFVGIIPALALLTPDHGGPLTFSFAELCWWCFAIAFFGVFAAVPLRKQTILREKLKFPSGTATAEIIKVLHRVGQPARQESLYEMIPTMADPGTPEEALELSFREAESDAAASSPRGEALAMEAHEWRVLFGSFVLSASYTLAAHFLPILKNLPVMTWLGYPLATAWYWSLQPSLSYVGQGMIMGPRTAISMLLGTVIGWCWLGPMAQAEGWAPGPVGDSHTGAKGWLMWVSLAIMLGESFVSLGILAVRALCAAADAHNVAVDPDPAPRTQQVPCAWWTTGPSSRPLHPRPLLCVATQPDAVIPADQA